MGAGSELSLPLALFFPLFRFFFLALVAAGVELETGGVVPFLSITFLRLSFFFQLSYSAPKRSFASFMFVQKVCADLALSIRNYLTKNSFKNRRMKK